MHYYLNGLIREVGEANRFLMRKWTTSGQTVYGARRNPPKFPEVKQVWEQWAFPRLLASSERFKNGWIVFCERSFFLILLVNGAIAFCSPQDSNVPDDNSCPRPTRPWAHRWTHGCKYLHNCGGRKLTMTLALHCAPEDKARKVYCHTDFILGHLSWPVGFSCSEHNAM